jgi:hypothetical protein
LAPVKYEEVSRGKNNGMMEKWVLEKMKKLEPQKNSLL